MPKKARIEWFCSHCNNKFYIQPCRSFRKFCSTRCTYESRKINGTWNKGLLGYGKEWLQSTDMINKRNAAIPRGNKNMLWKGGVSPLAMLIRKLPESKTWNIAVMKNCEYKCVECGINEDKLHVHHKNQFNKILKEFLSNYSQFSPIEDKETLVRLATSYEPFWDVNNGEVLCKECHKLEHNIIGY